MEAENNKGRDMVGELQKVISKLPVNVCCTTVLPEFGVRWTEVARALRNYRLPMESASIARVLCRHIAKYDVPEDELRNILAKLKLHLATLQGRTWHVIHLQEALGELPPPRDVGQRVQLALRGLKAAATAEVQSTMLDSLLYLSIQVSGKQSAVYVASPPGEPVALVSTLGPKKLLQAAVEGLGYSTYFVANLHGRHIPSLLRISSSTWGGAPLQLAGPEPYAPVPQVRPDSIDYTTHRYDAEYVDKVLGPDPPILNSLTIKTTTEFFDKSLISKTINLTMNLKSSSIAKTLKTWVVKGAIAPNSGFLDIFHKTKANRLTLTEDNDGESDSE